MKLFYKTAIVVITVALCFSFKNEPKWKLFKGDGFTIEFPGVPSDNSQKTNSAVGELNIKIHMYEGNAEDESEENLVYGAISTEYPIGFMKDADKEAIDEVYKGAIEGAVKNVKGKLISNIEYTHNGHPGREIKIDFQEGLAVITMRCLLIENKMYMLQSIAITEKDNNKSSAKFFNSFKLI